MKAFASQPEAPIGVFDSGLGGLTVFREIAALLPQEDLIYFGDSARLPYGIKSPETVRRYSLEIGDFLNQHSVKAIVVACNTASAVALESLQAKYTLPVLGVIEPGALAAASVTVSGQVALIGTEATVASQAYQKALKQISPQLEVQARACPLFVPLVEEGWTEHGVTEAVARIYLKDLMASTVDTLILACTHYPLLKGLLARVLGEGIRLVDSAQESAQALQVLLEKNHLLARRSRPGVQDFYCSDAPEKMQQLGGAFLGQSLGRVKKVLLSA